MTRIVILSGSGSYADPWHPFETTSQLIREALAPLNGDVDIRSDVDAALADLDGTVTLVVANFGNPGVVPPEAAQQGLQRYLSSGGSFLAVHSSVTAFDDWLEWEQALGGRWVRGSSFHPPKSVARIHVAPDAPAIGDFDTLDERYTDLRTSPGNTVLATHTEGGTSHPVAWLAGPRRAVVTLGHDADAYSSAGARELLLASARLIL